MLIDTHAHLDDETLAGQLDAVLLRAFQADVRLILGVGTTADSSQRMVELARAYAQVFAAVGIHPNHCHDAASGDWDRILVATRNPRVKAIGETGLDRYWDFAPFELQQDFFDRHLRLAQNRDLPVVVHTRDCGQEALAMLQEARRRGPLRGVMHSFSGDAELARACIELGLYISFSGMVTFKKSDELRQVAKGILDDRILVETDSPYLSPHPKRGQRPNEPALVIHTAACLAEVRGATYEQFCTQTTANAQMLFRFGAV